MEISGVYVHQGGWVEALYEVIKTLEYVSIQILESFNHLNS